MLSYRFMQIAFVVGLLLSIVIPLVGTHVVFKRLSMTGDALSHTSLAGVALGLLFGINPLFVAIITTVVAALIIELIRKKFSKYSEMAIAIVLSFGVGLAGVLTSFTPIANFSTYLFGSIVAISDVELFLSIGVFVIVLALYLLFYKELMFIAYNENSARVSKVPVDFVNVVFTIITALTVAIASRTIGALIVSSLMVVPVATSLQFAKSYKSTILFSVLFSFSSVIIGLTLSFYQGLKPGGTIVLISVAILFITLFVKSIVKIINTKSFTKNRNE